MRSIRAPLRTNMALLNVSNLQVCFHTRNGTTVAVEDMNFELEAGQVLGIVGESGSGKSVACYSLLGLRSTPPGKVERGSAIFAGKDLLQMSERELRLIRGNKICMVFQDPMTCLNPYIRIVDQLTEPLRLHRKLSKRDARVAAIAALKEVGIDDAEKRINDYPHQFSGGMRQRVMIAMALITEPELLIADEPTTALDVTVQAQILELIKNLQKTHNLAVVFITHDLGVAAIMADNILVMEKGVVVEQGSTKSIFENPQHEYTKKLLGAVLTTGKPGVARSASEQAPLLQVSHLQTYFETVSGGLFTRKSRFIKGVDDVSIHIRRGEILGLVGESGS